MPHEQLDVLPGLRTVLVSGDAVLLNRDRDTTDEIARCLLCGVELFARNTALLAPLMAAHQAEPHLVVVVETSGDPT